MTYSPILDISRYQYPVDFQVMKAAGVELVILRLTVGNYYKDTRFDEFYTAARAAGLVVGAYHVVKPAHTASSQFIKILDSLGERVLDVPLVVLDCELTDNKTPSVIAANIEALALSCLLRWEVHPIIYTRGWWWNTNTVTKPVFQHCPLWIARYSETITHPWADAPNLRPRDWTDWDLWQYSADGNLKGAQYGCGSNSVDINRANASDLAGTLAILGGTQPPEPDPTPEPGEPPMKFTNPIQFNIRSSPATLWNNDVGDLPKNSVITALEIRATDSNSVWVRFQPDPAWVTTTTPEYWAAIVHDGQGPLLNWVQA